MMQGEQPAVAFGDGEALKGRTVVKKFGRRKYIGEVVGFDSETKWYKVLCLVRPQSSVVVTYLHSHI